MLQVAEQETYAAEIYMKLLGRLELNHSRGELLTRQEKINRTLTEEVERLRAEVSEFRREQEKPKG
jgi:hypothetical protein